MRTKGDFDTVTIGSFGKTHGLKGEIVLNLETEAYEVTPEHFVFAIRDGGLQVPYRVESTRTIKDGVIVVKLKDVTYEEASDFNGLPATAPSADVVDDSNEDDIFYLEDLIGFRAYDGDTELGEIIEVDDSTWNVLLRIRTTEGRDILVPANEELIAGLDTETRNVIFSLPEGLVELN